MKERPIIFSGPMVRAILEGRKTMTRRVAKAFNQPEVDADAVHEIAPGEFIGWCGQNVPEPIFTKKVYKPGDGVICPYGLPGGRLWVRESYMSHDIGEWLVYKADFSETPMLTGWRPSIHMPRSVSRITLEITNVRLERLEEITVADCICEGIEIENDGSQKAYYSAYNEFRRLWKSIHGPESWTANPLVWAITFKRITP